MLVLHGFTESSVLDIHLFDLDLVLLPFMRDEELMTVKALSARTTLSPTEKLFRMPHFYVGLNGFVYSYNLLKRNYGSSPKY